MEKSIININNFSQGEVSDFAFCSQEIKANNMPASKINNLLVTPYGSLIRRPGSEFVMNIYHGGNLKMINFEDKNNFFMIEIYSGFLRFYKNNKPFIKNSSHYQIKSPLLEEDIQGCNWLYDDINKQIYLFSKNISPKILTWDNDYNFKLSNFEYKGGPYGDINKTNATMQIDKVEGNMCLIKCSVAMFTMEDIGRFIRIAHNGNWGEAKIVAYSSETLVVVDVIHAFASVEPSKVFSLGQWGGHNGYPSKGTIFNGRLYLASSLLDKKNIWVSKLWDYSDFSPITRVEVDGKITTTVTYDNAINIKVSEGREILWLSSNKDNVLFGSSEGIFSINAMNSDEALSPYNYIINQVSAQTSSDFALSFDYITIHADTYKKNLYSVIINQDKLLSIQNISFYAKHLFTKGIKALTLINYPFIMLWVLMEDGSLACSTMQNTIEGYLHGWHRHQLGGENSKILAFSSSYDNENAYLWLYVSRVINNIEQRSLEIIKFDNMDNLYEFSRANSNSYYLDNHRVSYLKAGIVANLEDFNNSSIAIISKDKEEDYIYFNQQKVQENRVVFLKNNYDDCDVIVGYNFESSYSLNFINNSSSFFNFKKLNKVKLMSQQSKHVFLMVGNKNYKLNTMANLKSYGVNHINVDCSWEQFLKIELIQQHAYNLIINAINFEVEIQQI